MGAFSPNFQRLLAAELYIGSSSFRDAKWYVHIYHLAEFVGAGSSSASGTGGEKLAVFVYYLYTLPVVVQARSSSDSNAIR